MFNLWSLVLPATFWVVFGSATSATDSGSNAPIPAAGAMGVVTVAVILMSSLLLLRMFRKKRDDLDPAKIPPVVVPKVNIPILDKLLNLTFVEFGKSPLKMVTRCEKEYGPVFSMKMFGQNITFLLGPEAQEPFFKSNDSIMSQSEVYGFMKSVFGKDVVYDCPAKKRQVQFQSMAHGLRTTRLKTYTKKIEKETIEFLDQKWGEVSVCVFF